MFDALCCIASLVKISSEFDHISVGYTQKTDQKQPEIVLSAGMKTFEILKPVNCKSGVNEWDGRGATKKTPENATKLRES